MIVELVADGRKVRAIGSLFEGIRQASLQLLERYTDTELELLLDFLRRCNAIGHAETLRLRAAGDAPLDPAPGPAGRAPRRRARR